MASEERGVIYMWMSPFSSPSAVARLRAGVAASSRSEESFAGKLDQLLSGECDGSAAEFASRYAAFEPAAQRRGMLERVTGVLS